MKVLGIESSGNNASVAITDEHKTICEISVDYKKTHAETLMPMIEELFTMTESNMNDINLIAVSAGPGSYTGLRIGIASAKALAFACGKPAVAVPTLDAMAYNVFTAVSNSVIVPLIDARRERAYTAFYRCGATLPKRVSDYSVKPVTEICDELKALLSNEPYIDTVVFLGDGFESHRSIIEASGIKYIVAPTFANMQRAACVAAMGLYLYKSGKDEKVHDLQPFYLQKTQAETKIYIVPMELKHVDRVMEIEEGSFSIPWTRKDFIQELTQNKQAIYLIAKRGNEVLGYGGMWHVINEGHITNVAVKESERRQGIGDMLIKGLIDIAVQKEMVGLTLEVRMNNTNAFSLYKKHGFKAEGIRKNYYADTKEDAIIMWKYF